jgi:hypothetical protein
MAFFGLTALGPQNCFEYISRSSTHIFVFEDKDFEFAWKKVLKSSSVCETEADMNNIFKALYRGPVPDSDQRLMAQNFAHLQAPYSREDFMATLIDLRDRKEAETHELREGMGPACDFFESVELQAAIRKNKASDRTLQDKQSGPLTACQEYGWYEQELKPPAAHRVGSDVTKFAAELIKNGIYY